MTDSQKNKSSLTKLVCASCVDHLPCLVDGIIWQRAERETGFFSRCWVPQYTAGVCDHQQLWPHGNPRPASPVHLCNTITRKNSSYWQARSLGILFSSSLWMSYSYRSFLFLSIILWRSKQHHKLWNVYILWHENVKEQLLGKSLAVFKLAPAVTQHLFSAKGGHGSSGNSKVTHGCSHL